MGITGELLRAAAACRQNLGPTIRVFSTHSDIYTVDIYTVDSMSIYIVDIISIYTMSAQNMIKAQKLIVQCNVQGQNGKPTHIKRKGMSINQTIMD